MPARERRTAFATTVTASSWPTTRSCSRSSILRSFETSPSRRDRKSTRLNSSHDQISYAVFCLKKKNRHDRSEEHRSALGLRSDLVLRRVLVKRTLDRCQAPVTGGQGRTTRACNIRDLPARGRVGPAS